jgi:hypothetical protein
MAMVGDWTTDTKTNYAQQALGLQAGNVAAGGDYARSQRDQYGAMGMYRDAAMGLGPPSQAQVLAQQQGDQNAAMAMSLAAQNQGGNPQASARNAVSAHGAAGVQSQQQMAALRAQEQQSAMAGYAGMGAQMSGQALGQQSMFGQQQMGLLGMQTQNDQFQQQLELERDKYKTQRNQGWAQMGVDVAGAASGVPGMGA